MADVKYFADLSALTVPVDNKIIASQDDPKGSTGYKTTYAQLKDWVNSVGTTPNFSAWRGTAVTNAIGGSTSYKIPFNVKSYDATSDYNNTTYEFTPSVTGTYLLNFAVSMSSIGNTNTDMTTRIVTTSRSFDIRRENSWADRAVGEYLTVSGSAISYMTLGQTAHVEIYSTGTAGITVRGGLTEYTYFSGILLQR